eukprot:4587714-Alexandrium_andersonii.AAC.1
MLAVRVPTGASAREQVRQGTGWPCRWCGPKRAGGREARAPRPVGREASAGLAVVGPLACASGGWFKPQPS